MKLLKLKIENKEGFRSLQEGFEINFHTLADADDMLHFRPFCFAGLNGSGKSNVLEALANIFYHLEICVARYLPERLKDLENFNRTICTPDAFSLEYLIANKSANYNNFDNLQRVVIAKKVGEEPGIKVYDYPFENENIVIPNPRQRNEDQERIILNSNGKKLEVGDKIYLPDHIIGYSSGENEILSLPFIKSRLLHLDEYRQATENKHLSFDEPENSLIYIDRNMSQAVLLACLLFENENALASLRNIDNTGILDLRSFRMNIHLYDFIFQDDKQHSYSVPIFKLLEDKQLKSLKECSTSWFFDDNTNTLCLDFYVTDATKIAFKDHFHSGIECFQLFSLLYELNNYSIDNTIKEDIYRSKGVYTDGKLPAPSPSDDVFHFLDFYLTKELDKTGTQKDLLLRSFSDGEHQFLHTMGICLLLKSRRTLLLLDEPETHFNPSWRGKFVKILNDSISAEQSMDSLSEGFNVHLLKDVLLTSHSPFIISDCLPDNVILFEKKVVKTERGERIVTTAKKVTEIEETFNTYGTSVELILNRLFHYDQSIGDLAFADIEAVDVNNISTKNDVEKAKESLRELGESIEKDIVLSQLNRKLRKIEKC